MGNVPTSNPTPIQHMQSPGKCSGTDVGGASVATEVHTIVT